VELFIVLLISWWGLLAIFYLVPELDLAVARAFFEQAACGAATEAGRICGGFPYASQKLFVVIRQILFYLPVLVAIYILYRLIANLQHSGIGYSFRRTRDYSIALISLAVGPYLLVNLFLKQISNRPRPYETDLFGGREAFMPAGDFSGACSGNCSFISGEAAGAGWVACLIVLMPKPLRPILGPPLIITSMISPALRTSFGGHYLSDVVLGWLSSLVVYAGVAACFQMSQRARKRNSQTNL
jgi:membrane-associated phospholipid phosphatase